MLELKCVPFRSAPASSTRTSELLPQATMDFPTSPVSKAKMTNNFAGILWTNIRTSSTLRQTPFWIETQIHWEAAHCTVHCILARNVQRSSYKAELQRCEPWIQNSIVYICHPFLIAVQCTCQIRFIISTRSLRRMRRLNMKIRLPKISSQRPVSHLSTLS